MVLVDTSIWVEHFRNGSAELRRLLLDGQVYCHPFIVGELACGHLKKRSEILDLLSSLQQAIISDDEEALQLIETRRLYGRGLGWIDVHILSSALLTGAQLWTFDKTLKKVAQEFNITYR
jgi:predicted nucleic acid-binding protein